MEELLFALGIYWDAFYPIAKWIGIFIGASFIFAGYMFIFQRKLFNHIYIDTFRDQFKETFK